MSLDPITAGIDAVTSIVNKIWPDKTQVERDKIASEFAVLKATFDAAQAQVDVNNTEARSTSLFVAGWIGWVCSAALAFQYIFRPLLAWGFSVTGHPLPVLPGIDDNLWQLMLGMLGLGGLRTYEKAKGVA
jgi:hypothetical protein